MSGGGPSEKTSSGYATSGGGPSEKTSSSAAGSGGPSEKRSSGYASSGCSASGAADPENTARDSAANGTTGVGVVSTASGSSPSGSSDPDRAPTGAHPRPSRHPTRRHTPSRPPPHRGANARRRRSQRPDHPESRSCWWPPRLKGLTAGVTPAPPAQHQQAHQHGQQQRRDGSRQPPPLPGELLGVGCRRRAARLVLPRHLQTGQQRRQIRRVCGERVAWRGSTRSCRR